MLVIRSPANRGEKFIVSLDRVAIKQEEVRGILLCVQDSVRSHHFTQRSFFSYSGVTILCESVPIAGSITSSPVYAPWSIVETACANQVITDLRACWDRVVLRQFTAKDTSGRRYQGGTTRSDAASKPGVRILDVAEEGRVEFVLVASPALSSPGPSKIRSSPSKR